MKLEDCRKLKIGDKVLVCIGRYEYQTMTFKKLVHVVSYGRTTISEFLAHGLTGKGRNKTEAELEYINDRGRKEMAYLDTRKIISKA